MAGSIPTFPRADLVWAVVIGHILRVDSFLRLEWLAHSPVRAGVGHESPFGDDALAYCTERMDPETTRLALAAALHQAKRNKAFENSRFIGLALDGTGAGRTYKEPCPLCDPIKDAKGEVHGSLHHFVLISVVGVGLTLPVDVEPYGPGDSEYAAAQRLLRRAVDHLGPRFADYVVGDGEYATAPFLHTTGEVGLPVVARLKENLPLLAAAVRARFDGQPPQAVFQEGDDRVEVWDDDDFDPWETLDWPDRARAALPPAQTRRHRRPSRMADRLPHRQAGQPEFLPHGQEPLGDRESAASTTARTAMAWSTSATTSANSILIVWLLIAAGLGHRTPLPAALSASWRPWHSLRHGLVYLSLVEPGFPQPARHRLNPAPRGRLAALRCSLTTRPLFVE